MPREYNAATWFVDRHVAEGRGGRLAVIHEGGRLTYGDVAAGANRLGNALRRLGVQREQRVMLLLYDSPEFVWSFWGALKIGAVPIPTNTLLKPHDYEYILRDGRAEVAIVSGALAPALAEARPRAPALKHIVVAGRASGGGELAYDDLVSAESSELAPAETTKDDVAFWLYTSGTTGTPKAAVHLHHDMQVCCEAFGRHVLEIGPDDRTFSVAKLFFAYGLGNALYFPFHVGATTVLLSGRPEPAKVFEVINRERPTLFFAVPTAYAAMLQLPDAGRGDDMIKAGGMWVSPAEVEGALVEHPAVVEAGVVGTADQDDLVKPVAFVVLARGHAPGPALEAELQAFVKQRLAHYKYPRWIRFVEELPKTATGKIQRFKLREIATQPQEPRK